MASLPQSHRVTYEEWLRMPEVKGTTEEVVNGEIRHMPAPSWKHAEVVQNTHDQIRPQVDHREVAVVITQFDLIIRLQPLSTRQPDLAMFLRETIVEKDGRVHSAPQLIGEVLSPSNTWRERDEKLADYASLGVPEVWFFSPQARTIEVLHLESGRYRHVGTFAEGNLKPLHFPNVQIDIARIWPD
jgi:Uma2 family endonuclease